MAIFNHAVFKGKTNYDLRRGLWGWRIALLKTLAHCAEYSRLSKWNFDGYSTSVDVLSSRCYAWPERKLFFKFFGYWIILSISGRFPTKLGKVGNSGITTIHSFISFLPLLSCFFINQHCNYTHIPCNIRSTLTTSATPYPPPSLHRAWS